MVKYQSIIINLLDEHIDSIINKIKGIKSKLSTLEEDGTIWIITSNYVEDSELVLTSFEVAKLFQELNLKNIVLVPDFKKLRKGEIFTDVTYEILFFSKSSNYFLNKDPIREKHIWKDVEWGKRINNYHELGKDPGNVWLKTEDDGHARITEHIPLKFGEVINRIIKISTKKESNCLLINLKKINNATPKEVIIHHENS